jgi:CBS domain-containing protein
MVIASSPVCDPRLWPAFAILLSLRRRRAHSCNAAPAGAALGYRGAAFGQRPRRKGRVGVLGEPPPKETTSGVGVETEGREALLVEATHMQVKHILREKGREVVTITNDATLSEAARLLSRKRIGAVVVRDRDGSVAGILSERDIVRAMADVSVNALAQSVSAYMTRTVYTCGETDTIEDLMELMTHRRFRHVPVVENERLVGIISIGDVVKTRIAETVREAESLREYIAAAG